ncbi:MAG TPA: hypothetical protein VI479_13855 [Blastocatellia bacterium]
MKRTLILIVIMSCLLTASGLVSVAQEKKTKPDGAKVPTDGSFKVIKAEFILVKVVKGAPYSATAITEYVQTLGDGNQIIRKNESKLYRDSEGRTRNEQTLETIGKWAAAGAPSQLIHIDDPVTGYKYDLDPVARTAIKGIRGINRLAKMEAMLASLRIYESIQNEWDPVAKTRKTVEWMIEMEKRRQEKLKTAEKQGKLKEDANIDDAAGRRKTESLGKRTIEGVEAEGSRVTITIPAGEIGNTLPIEIIDETWQSPELQLVVMSKHRDPRSGETIYRLTNISRSEPDRSLFEVPADYTVREGKAPLKKKPAKEEE